MSIFSRSRSPGSSSDPFDLIRYAAGFFLCVGTIVWVALWLSGITAKGLLLVGALWSVYGLIHVRPTAARSLSGGAGTAPHPAELGGAKG